MTAPVKQHSQRIVHSSEDPNWRTPRVLFDRLWAASGGFTMDLAADLKTRLVERFYGPGSPTGEDALTFSWAEDDPGGRGFLNPPYSKKAYQATKDMAFRIEAWAEKCWTEARAGYEVWGLLPFSPQAAWYREFIQGHELSVSGSNSYWKGFAASEVWRLPYRVDFDPSPDYVARVRAEFDAGTRKSAEIGSAGHNVVVVIWRPDPGFVGPWVPAERYWSYR